MTEDAEGGLDLSRPDSISPEERAQFTRFYEEHKGATLPGHEFWMAHDPGALKRYRRFAIEMNAPSSRAFPQVAVLCWLHYYAVIGFEEGIAYQIRNAQVRGGAQKSDIEATLHAAFLHSGPLGTRYVASASEEILSGYEEPEPLPWPAGWTAAPEAFRAGLDYNRRGLDDRETESLFDWYATTCGEVPDGVRFLARHNPEALKAYRMRFEHAAAAGLPNQMFVLLLLQLHVIRGVPEGIREAFALARGVGVSRQFAIDTVTRAMIYAGGTSAVSTVARAAGDILDSMD